MRRFSLSAAVLSALALVATCLGLAPANAIVGGYEVEEGKFRFMASIQARGSDGSDGHFCGGSVVGSRWILTAAHCVTDTRPREIQVAVGRTNIDDKSRGRTVMADRIVVHPKYESTGTFDAALIHTKAKVRVPQIPLVPLRNNSLERQGAPLTVAGWGTEFFGSPFASADLKAVDVEAVADENCTTNGAMGFREESEMCAETLGGDSCQGDSGGPLFGNLADGRRVQVGIVSYGLGCAVPAFPGVYAEVNNRSIHNFITSRTR